MERHINVWKWWRNKKSWRKMEEYEGAAALQLEHRSERWNTRIHRQKVKGRQKVAMLLLEVRSVTKNYGRRWIGTRKAKGHDDSSRKCENHCVRVWIWQEEKKKHKRKGKKGKTKNIWQLANKKEKKGKRWLLAHKKREKKKRDNCQRKKDINYNCRMWQIVLVLSSIGKTKFCQPMVWHPNF